MLFSYLKRYPLSLLLIAIVLYLSFFKPPSVSVPLFPGLDKVVHVCMYGAISGMLWIEFLRNHQQQQRPVRHALWGAIVCPILLGGVIELLQAYCTTYRGGDWLDFVANSTGVLLATAFAWWIVRPFMERKHR